MSVSFQIEPTLSGWHTRLILLSAPQAEAYYPHIGMKRHNSCWMIPPAS